MEEIIRDSINPWRDIPADVIRDHFSDMHLPENRSFQCCPSIECTKAGRLWAVWVSGGPTEPHIDNFGVVVFSDDGGKSWKDPYFIVDHPDVQRVRINYMTLWMDENDQLWICWSQTAADWGMKENAYLSSFAVCIKNPDAREPVCEKPIYMFPHLLHNKPVHLSNGEWLFAAEHVFDTYTSFIYEWDHSDRQPVLRGEVRSRLGWKIHHEAHIIEKTDGRLWILTRIEGNPYARFYFGGMEEAYSEDRGKTWTEFESKLPYPLTGPGARFHIRRLKSGALLLLNYNDEKSRSRLAAFLSDDDGKTWTDPYLFDDRDGVSYPDACETADGKIIVAYDRNRTTDAEILMVTLTEEEIRRGQPPKQVISRKKQ